MATIFFFDVWCSHITFQTGLSLGVVSVVQSNIHAQPKGKTVLHADVGFMPGLPQLPGVY